MQQQHQKQHQKQELSSSSASASSATNNRSTSNGLDILNQRREQMMQNVSARWQSEPVTQQRAKMKQGLQTIGSKLQKINLNRLIGDMEQDQGFANQLEMLNERMKEEALYRNIRREAEAACMATIQEHLTEFLAEHPTGTYEQWIEDLHPENTQDPSLLLDMDKEVDLRFYVEESDHRKLWNEHATDPMRQVQARTQMWSDNSSAPIVDLLSSTVADPTTTTDVHVATTSTTTTPTTTSDTSADSQEVDLISF
jgi:hypothetical protein